MESIIQENSPSTRATYGLSQVSTSNFHTSFIFLSRTKREALSDIYRYCRFADDLVDEVAPLAPKEARAGLMELRQEIHSIFDGSPKSDLGRRLSAWVRCFPIRREDLLEIIRGCEMDLEKKSYETFGELQEYCSCVAAAVGLVCVEVFGYQNPQAREYAVQLGYAFQLTNILRDIREDLVLGRIYLPQADLHRFNVTAEDLLAGTVNDSFLRLMAFETARAQSFYRAAEVLLAPEDSRALAVPQAMAAVYGEILKRIQENPRLVFQGKVCLTKMEKISFSLQGFLGSLVR